VVGGGKKGQGGWGLGKANSPLGQDVGCSHAKKQEDFLKMQERSGNVDENKGPVQQ
jgi:hypothetical protein